MNVCALHQGVQDRVEEIGTGVSRAKSTGPSGIKESGRFMDQEDDDQKFSGPPRTITAVRRSKPNVAADVTAT
jgi:hypothetical protein